MEQSLNALAAWILEEAQRAGATDADVLIQEEAVREVHVRLGGLERVQEARSRGLGLRVFVGSRMALVSSSDLSEEALQPLAQRAVEMAQRVGEDPFAGLPEVSATRIPSPSLLDPILGALSLEEGIQRALEAEQAAFDLDPRITRSEGASFQVEILHRIYQNTRGVQGAYQASTGMLSVCVVATENGRMQRDTWYTCARRLSDLEDPVQVGQEAARRALRRLGGRKIPTCQVPVVFDSRTASALLTHLFQAVSGHAVYQGASFLAQNLGKPVASPQVTVIDDGTLPWALGSRPFDGEGIPTRKTWVIREGILETFLLDTYAARKLGFPASTGNASRGISSPPSVGPNRFYLVPGPHSLEDILNQVSQGFYVTELMGFGYNPVTGDFSRGASGFWIEQGQLAYPVEEVTVAGNLGDCFRSIEVVGSDLAPGRRIAAPPLLVTCLTVAGA